MPNVPISAVLGLPALIRKYDPFGLRRVMMEQNPEE